MKLNISKPILFILVISLVLGSIAFIELSKPNKASLENPDIDIPNTSNSRISEKKSQFKKAKEIVNPAEFINTDNISINNLVGEKVILVDFWTYSCINCQRTLPYLNAWHKKYKDDGLVIVGIHAPEFNFEKKPENVRNAVDRFNISYPVVLDNSFSTWNAYDNRYWPQKYLIGIDGFIRYEHIGEGEYSKTEEKIQKLLAERAEVLDINKSRDLRSDFVNPNSQKVDFGKIKTPEIYFGASRNNLGNGESGTKGIQTLNIPKNLKENKLYLEGKWKFKSEYSKNLEPDSKIVLLYRAKKVNIVSRASETVNATIKIDGKIIQNISGRDVKKGKVMIKEERLYNLVNDSEYSEHKLDIIVEEKDLEVFTFTFG